MASPSLPEVYENLCHNLYDGQTRRLLTRALELVETTISNGENLLLFLEAPTGYGKSILSLTLYTAICQGRYDIASRIIHVLPMRSIGTDMKERMIKNVAALSNSLPVKTHDIGLQQMHSPGSPMLLKKFVITTLDTFISSFYKIPASEITKLKRYGTSHFEIPRAAIYTSIVVFDELHLYIGSRPLDSGRSKAFTAVMACIKSLLSAGVPVIVSTATLPKVIKEIMVSELKLSGLSQIIKEITPTDSDRDFLKRKITVETITEDIIEKICSEARQGRTLVILNTVRKAVETYEALKQRLDRVVLLHSRLIECAKSERLKLLSGSEPLVLVATQVVEAGVDVSFRTLITEAAPPDSILQRAGRVARKGGEGWVYVFPLSKEASEIYNEKIVNTLYNRLEDEHVLDHRIINVYDEYFELKQIDLMDNVYRNILRDIDLYPSYSVNFAEKVWNAVCGFVREGEQITIIPRRYLELVKNHAVRFSDYVFCVDDKIFERMMEKGMFKYALYEDMTDGDFKLHGGGCLSNQLFKKGIIAFVLEDEQYSEEVGFAG